MQSKESIDAAVEDVSAKPWLPLPLGLKPPSTECFGGTSKIKDYPTYHPLVHDPISNMLPSPYIRATTSPNSTTFPCYIARCSYYCICFPLNSLSTKL